MRGGYCVIRVWARVRVIDWERGGLVVSCC